MQKENDPVQCSVCHKHAQFICGHGCRTVYCGKSCARSVYEMHKQQCEMLIGTQSGADLLNRWNYQSANAINLRQAIERSYNEAVRMLGAIERANFFQRGHRKAEAQAMFAAFIDAAGRVVGLRPDLDYNTQHSIIHMKNMAAQYYQANF